MATGFIRLNRKYFEHSFWKEERKLSAAEAWLDLIAFARFDAAPEKLFVRMKPLTINRGELRASQRFLQIRWHWSLGKVNRFLKFLEMETMIVRRTEHNETIITILNYSRFNPLEKLEVNTNGNDNNNTNENTIGTPTGTPSEHQQIQTKDREEFKKEKNSLFRQRFFSVLELFYFKNFKNPIAVTNSFFNHYEGVGWKNARGLDIENVESVADNWDNKTTEGLNCPVPLLLKWKVMFGILRNNSNNYSQFLLIRPAKLENKTLIIRGKQKDIEAIENDKELLEVWRNALFMTFGKINIEYELDKQTAAA